MTLPRGGRTEELRAVVPTLPALLASGQNISVKRTMTGVPKPPPEESINFNNVVHAGQYVVFYLQTTQEPFLFLAAKAAPQQTLVYSWRGQGAEGTLTLPLPPPNAALNALLDRSNFIRESNGKLTEAFTKQLLSVLHEISLLKARELYSTALTGQLQALEPLVKNLSEQAEMEFLKTDLMSFIQGEKQPTQTAKRKRCVQELSTQATSGEYHSNKVCDDITSSIYQ